MREHQIDIYFSDHFDVRPSVINRYGSFNISLLADLPLFIDPFLLFNSRKPAYRKLHDGIIKYLTFLKDQSVGQQITPGLIKAWYRFPEVKQNWLGFSETGNRGSGLGGDFANALNDNLNRIFSDFGAERVTKGSHLEKLCLIKDRVGKDNISDFTTNLILEFLLEYTQRFAIKHVAPALRKKFRIPRVRFNYDTEIWESAAFDLPRYQNDFVLLTPTDILTKDETWINRTGLVKEFDRIPESIPNEELRAQVNNYFKKMLPKKPRQKDEDQAALSTLRQFPQLIDYYIKYKEDTGDKAQNISSEKVEVSKQLYVEQFRRLAELLAKTKFYDVSGNTYEEAHNRIAYLKDVIENKGGHRIFYLAGKAIDREKDLHILYRLTWYATSMNVSAEVDNGRGPVDFEISAGSQNKSLVEWKLARNTQLKRNLEKQTPIYEKASGTSQSIKVIVYFSKAERVKVDRILRELKMSGSKDIVLIDARKDNKPSGSKA